MKNFSMLGLLVLLFISSGAATVSPGVCSVQIASQNCSICNLCNGSATATPTGKAPYTYSWSPAPPSGQGSASVTGLCPGTYTVSILDSTGCTSSASVVITQPASPTASAQSNNILCGGTPTGSITVTASGGKNPLTYSWTPAPGSGQGTPHAGNLAAGTYTCSISDANGCGTKSVSTIVQPAPLQLAVTATNVTCSGCSDGTVSASASGGTAPYSYSWEFITATGCCATGLTAGNYTCCIKDANNCPICNTISVSYHVGISNPGLSAEVIGISPNPFNSTLRIELENARRESQVEICNVLGEMLLQRALPPGLSELNTADLPAGLYFISIRNREEKLLVRKLLKQ